MRDLGDLWVALAVPGQLEARPCGVVGRVGLQEVPVWVRRADKVVDPDGRARDVDLLPLRGLMVLVNPPRRDALIARVAIEVRPLRRWRVVVQPVPIDQAERRLDRLRLTTIVHERSAPPATGTLVARG